MFRFFRVAILFLFPLLLVSCQSGQEEESTGEREEISIGYWYSYSPFVDDELSRFIEDKFSISIKPVTVGGYDWDVDYNKLLTASQMPDLFVSDYLGYGAYGNLINSNLVMKIDVDRTKYPDLAGYMDDPYFDYFKNSEGFLYCIPRIGFEKESYWGLNRVFLVRKDWLEALGISYPENYQQFKEMLLAFRDGDPDGNGIDDTIGLDIENANKIEALYLGIDPYFSNIERGWVEEDGSWIPVWCSKKMADNLWYFDDLFESGALNPDFAFMSDIQAIDNFINGRTGCIAYPYFQLLKLYGQNEEFFINSVAVLHPWTMDGEELPYRFTTTKHWSEIYINPKISDYKKDLIYSLLDYLISEEFDKDVEENGFYDSVSYKFYSELVIYDISKYYRLGYMIKSPELREYIDSEIDWVENGSQPVDYDWEVTFLQTENKNRMPSNLDIHEAIVRAVLSDSEIHEAWAGELEMLKKLFPIDAAIAEVAAIMSK